MPVLPNASLPGTTGSGSLGSQLGTAVQSSFLGGVGISSAAGRVNVSEMFKYGFRYVDNVNGPSFNVVYPAANQDWRVRVSLAPNSTYFYNDPNNTLLTPLKTIPGMTVAGALNTLTGGKLSGADRIGVVFPYTPQVAVTHNANYTPQEITHSNYKNYFYNYSEVEAITVTADFTIQSIDEGQYLLASIYFFRSLTKMFFGTDTNAGNPPPMVYLNGYGQYYLPNVPCVVTKFSHTMPADVDYIDVPEPAVTQGAYYNPQLTAPRLNSTRLPTTSAMTVTLQPIYSRLSQTAGFSLNDFANGALVNPVNASNPATGFGASAQANYTKFRPTGGFL